MNMEQMQRRCPASRSIGKAFLRDYKFAYDGYSTKWEGAVSNIIKSRSDTVWGRLFEIDKECLDNLDFCEGYNKAPKSYDRKNFEIRDESRIKYEAIAYFREGRKLGKPSEKYRQTILQGARDCGLPEEYIKTYL